VGEGGGRRRRKRERVVKTLREREQREWEGESV
jgi:hypothetical protein